jgi:hypothetical protein
MFMGTYHRFFLGQPFDLSGRLIGPDPSFFLRRHLRARSAGRGDLFFARTIDLDHGEHDLERKLSCPLLAFLA